MDKLKQYKYVILIGIMVLGIAFYWYEIRPSQIRKGCYNIAREKAIKNDNQYNSSGVTYQKDTYDTYYKWCLEEKGL